MSVGILRFKDGLRRHLLQRNNTLRTSQDIANMVKDATQPPSTVGASHSPTTTKAETNAYWPIIATKDQIPGWLRDNDYIVWGHPMPTYSFRRSLRLWRCLHMETMNIWTHLIGSIGFMVVGLSLWSYVHLTKSLDLHIGDKIAFGASTSAAVICFALSATFHTLRSHSYNVHHFWGKMDILGICVLGLGGGVSAANYAWYCKTGTLRLYWAFNLCAAVAAAVTLFDTGGGGSRMRNLRGGVFFLLAISAMLPIFHRVGSLGWNEACAQIGAHWYLAEGLTLLIGVGLFVGRLPERLSPGLFDIWGHSHQLFHTCAVVGTAFHVVALVTGFNYRRAHPQC